MKKHLLIGLLTISYTAVGYTASPAAPATPASPATPATIASPASAAASSTSANPAPFNNEALPTSNQPIEIAPAPTSTSTSTTTTTTAPEGTIEPATTTTTKQVQTKEPDGTTTTTKQVETTAPDASSGNSTTSTSTTTTVINQPQGPVDCNYHIAPEVAVTRDLVLKWAERAAIQSFNFNYNAITAQLTELKVCYTEQGWQSFNDALEKSGNLNTIKAQQLTVSSSINGASQITEVKDNQWKVSVPVQVNYESSKEKIAQQLVINLIIGRKLSGDLGIMQMVAIPSNAPKNTTPASNPVK